MSKKLTIKSESEHTPPETEWIWKNYITSRQFNPLDISYESSKTLLAITITALLSNNQSFPDG